MKRAVWALLPFLPALAGCTAVLSPGEEQCTTTKDCTARGFADAVCNAGVCEKASAKPKPKPDDPVWGCLGHVVEPVPDPTKKVTFSIRGIFTDLSPVADAVVDVCAKLDLTCADTDPSYPKGVMSEPDGTVTLTVIQGFDGFVQVKSPEIMDTRVYVGRPIVEPPSVKEVRLIKPGEYSALSAFAGLTVDPTRGTAMLFAEDCAGKAAGGVSFACPALDSMGKQFYLVNFLPTLTATHTDVDGYGGCFNLPTGPTLVRSIRASDMTPIGESGFGVFPNTISAVVVSPTPL